MALLGMRGTGSYVAESRPKNWREGILRLYPNGQATFTPFLAMVDSEQTSDPEYAWWEKDIPTRTVYVNNGAGYTNAATTFVVDDSLGGDPGIIFRKGAVLKNMRTKEQYVVASDQTAGTSVVVLTRPMGETAAAALLDNDEIRQVGNAFEEGSDIGNPIQYDPVKRFNYTQIFRTPLNITRTAKKTRLRTEEAKRQAKIEALELQSVDMEFAFLWGERKELASGAGGMPQRTTRGLVRTIEADAPANDFTVTGGAMDETELLSYLEIVFRFGSTEKLMLAGSTMLNVLTRIAKGGTTLFVDSGSEIVYGIRLRRFMTAFGDLLVKQHPLFNLYTDWRQTGVIVDMANIRYRYIDDLQYLRNRQGPGIDAMKDEFLAECGLEVHHPKTHAIIRGAASFG